MLTDSEARGSCFCFPLVLSRAVWGGWKVEADGRGLSAYRAGTGDPALLGDFGEQGI